MRGANESFRKFLADDVPRGGLMRGVEEAVQKADGDRPDAGIPKGSDRLAHSGLVERGFDMPVVEWPGIVAASRSITPYSNVSRPVGYLLKLK